MIIHIELSEKDLKQLVHDDIVRRLGVIPFDAKQVSIKVKSKQNFKSEWEEAAFKAELDVNTQ